MQQQQTRLTSYSHGGGCACKLATHELAEILSHVGGVAGDPAVLVGLVSPDDAGVLLLGDGVAIVQTVDFFTPIVDDPYDWGRIAAANALSDVYAMGGLPRSALNLVAWPRSLDLSLVGRVLEGGAAVCDEAGVSVVGGHSVDDPEPKFGLAVTGTVDPAAIVRRTGASPGCDLVLTKPLGLGVISSGIKAGKASEDVVQRAIEVMTTLNRDASEEMVAAGAEAATDVTGFGLIGHLRGMLGDRLSATLSFGAIPLLPGALELAEQGVVPGGSRTNMVNLGQDVVTHGLSDSERLLLFDAQTSGGLLIASRPEAGDELLAVLRRHGVDGARIGTVVEGNGTVTVER